MKCSSQQAVTCFLALAVLGVTPAQARSITLPFTEDFATSELSDDWAADTSSEAALEVENGVLHIHARANTYAHIERALDRDGIRVSALINPQPAITWTPSLFLYWDSANYCQIGILADDVYYITEVTDGVISENRHKPKAGSGGHYVAIELGTNVIRYLAGTNGRDWESQRVTARPRGKMAGAPSLLIVGKGHSFPETYPEPDLDNDYRDPAHMTHSTVDNISVVTLEAQRMKLSEEDLLFHLEGPDEKGAAVLAAPGDPTFEMVAGYYPAMQLPREALGDKDGHLEFVVLPDATLVSFDPPNLEGDPDYANAAYVFFEVGDPAVRFGAGGAPVETCPKRLMDGYLPIVISDYEYQKLNVQETLFALGDGLGGDNPLTAYVCLTVTNPTQQSRTVPVACKVQHKDQVQTLATWQLVAQPLSQDSACIKVPYTNMGASATPLDQSRFQRKLEHAAASWRGLLNKGMRISVPETRINHAYRAWLGFNFINVDERGDGVYRPHDGSGFYEHIYGYSAGLYCIALDMYGYPDEAAQYLESLATFITPEGLFTMNFGLPDTGVLLWAMAEHYQFTQDQPWLRRVAPDMIRMCRYVIRKRSEMIAQQDKDSITYGLIKARPYCDDPVPTYYYVTDATLVVGMEAAANALKDIGSEEVPEIGREAKHYRRDILASMDRAVIEHLGMDILPLYAETQGMLKKTHYNANGYYGLCAGVFLETEFLDPHHRFMDLVLNMLRQRGGLTLGVCRFDDWGPTGIDHAYTYGYWLSCLKRSDVEDAILGLYSSMAYGMSRTTYAGVEVHWLAEGKNASTLPHLYSGTQQLRLLRNMLLREEEGNLLLGQAIPRHWLKPGQKVEVERAPTRFGLLSYTIAADTDGHISVTLDPPLRNAPQAIILHVRRPQETPIQSVTVDGRKHMEFDTETLTLKQLRRRMRIDVTY